MLEVIFPFASCFLGSAQMLVVYLNRRYEQANNCGFPRESTSGRFRDWFVMTIPSNRFYLTNKPITDAEIALIPLVSPGVTAGSAMVHTGFSTAFNSVASGIISAVRSQLAAHPGYTLISVGHSLGGALSSLGGLSLKSNFPTANVIMYTFGQPRTGDPNYAALVDRILGVGNIFRGTHTTDGVPTIIPTSDGYKHHCMSIVVTLVLIDYLILLVATEFWQNPDPGRQSLLRITCL